MPTSLTRSFLMLATVATSSCCSTIHSSLILGSILGNLAKSGKNTGMICVCLKVSRVIMNEWGNPRNENYE